jgi:hypothetical protein
MITSAVSDGPEGLEQPTFVYAKCGHTETTTLASDPLRSDAFGWINGDCGRPGDWRQLETVATSTNGLRPQVFRSK